MKKQHLIIIVILSILFPPSGNVVAGPVLSNPSLGTLGLLTPEVEKANLNLIDGLEFDSNGNLFGVLEISGSLGGLVFVDKVTGMVTSMATGISRADQLSFAPSGKLYVTSETGPPSTTNRIYEVNVGYTGSQPNPATTSVTSFGTSDVINNPEGIVALPSNSGFGSGGDLVVAEDKVGGRILKIKSDGTTSVLVDSLQNLQRPEGLALGDFNGAEMLAVYVAETRNHQVLRIDHLGNTTVLGNPSSVNLVSPDNVRFGPDGFLYVAEDLADGRILRVDADGTYSVFASGFAAPAGMAFDPVTGDMYIAEQAQDQIWRVQFAAIPEPRPYLLFLVIGFLVCAKRYFRSPSIIQVQ